MKKIIVKFDSLDGVYEIDVDINQDIVYKVNSTIAIIPPKEEELLKENKEEFLKGLKESNIINWNKEYLPTGLKIDDPVKWDVTYKIDDFIYHSSGEEGYWPYEYDTLINVLSIIDNDIKYFISNQK